ncbi:MAG: hypothetical protein IIZ11_01265 [Erysipelotrichaceae bacterium]|nr:hypothetical protein [Erysipelotrichaceae bacterium]
MKNRIIISDYTATINEDGQLEVKLAPSFLKTLANGKHTITGVFLDPLENEKAASASWMMMNLFAMLTMMIAMGAVIYLRKKNEFNK